MSKLRLERMLSLYRNYENGGDLDRMIAELRGNFLDSEVVSKKYNHDITGELASGPEHVLFYLAEYIDILEKQNKRYWEAIIFTYYELGLALDESEDERIERILTAKRELKSANVLEGEE